MTLNATVVAHDHAFLLLDLLLWAMLGNVADFVTVAALGLAAIGRLSSISKTFKVLVNILGPQITIARARRVPLKAVRDRVLLVDVSLQVHVGQGGGKGTLNSNEPKADVLSAETFLKLDISRVGGSLDIGLNGFLDVVEVAGRDNFHDVGIGQIGIHVLIHAAVDLLGSGALLRPVALFTTVATGALRSTLDTGLGAMSLDVTKRRS